MNLPDTYQFSASSLQDFVDCPARFFLRYVRQLRYPAPELEPLGEFEEEVGRGSRFHRLVHQYGIGIPPKALEATIPDETIAAWWQNFRAHVLPDLPERRHWEITLTAPLAGRRLVAKYDLLALEPGRAVIVDWKTAQRRPSREVLENRLQTVVYPYVLALAGAHLNGGQPIAPDAIRMIYWYAEFPQRTEVFTYSAKQFERDGARLASLAADILGRADESAFELTDDLERCQYCRYRSLHDRGAKAGELHAAYWDEMDDLNVDLDLDQIAESQF